VTDKPFDSLLDRAPDAVLTADEDGRVKTFNAAAERLFGCHRDEALGRRVAELVALPPTISDAGVDVTVVRPDGSEVPVQVWLVPSDDPTPGTTLWIRDAPSAAVAARKQALLEAAEELAQVGSWEWAPAEGRAQWSESVFRIFGLEPGAIAPTPEYVVEHTHPDDRDRVIEMAEQLRFRGELQPVEYRIIRPDRSVRHLRVTLVVAEERGGKPYRLVGWVQDVTERRWAERQITAHFAVAESLVAWDTLESGGERLLAALAEAMAFVAGTLWVPLDDALEPRVTWHAPSPAEREPVSGEELAGRAWQRREPVSRGEAIAIPAISGEDVLAVVTLTSREEIELTAALRQSLTGIGYELGQFLGRRRGQLDGRLLTPRELEVLRLGARGLSARETAERLVVSPATVRTHFENIYAKLEVSDKASAVATAMRRGLID
jgi:PAS domain S-box-containing protein